MEALQVLNFKSPPVFTQIDRPVCGDDDVVIKVSACGLNFADLLMINGTYQETPKPPFTLGLELAGHVEQIGAHVTHLTLGDRVAAYAGSGGLAEYAVVAADRCVKLPQNVSDAQGAGMLITYGTSHVALAYRARLQKDQRVLVLGASGGVGLTAVEIGAAMGGHVVACARGTEKLAIAKAHGAHDIYDTSADDFIDTLKSLDKFDVIYDPIGGDIADVALRRLNPEGQYLTIGFASGTVPKFPGNILLVKNISVHGLYWGGLLQHRPQMVQNSIATIFDMAATGHIKADPHHVFPFADAIDALEFLRQRKSTGKIVVTI